MKIIITTGGTGGHINPALAVAAEMKKRHPDAGILFVGAKGKMEEKLVPAAGFRLETIDSSGFQRSLSPQNIKRNVGAVINLLKSAGQSKKIIKGFNPDLVVGFGAYVSGPVVRAAAKMGIKTAIHEQNAFPGITNKALAKMVDVVMLASSDAEKHITSKNKPIVTGLPIREEILNADRDFSRAELKLDGRPLIFSVGGSLGARKINEAVIALISELYKEDKYNFIHGYGQYGKWVPEKLRENGIDPENSPGLRVTEYIYDMDKALSAADLVINRAGAATLTEIAAIGAASILIPSPNVTENHQYHNAMALVKQNAAYIIEEKDLTPEILIKKAKELLADPENLKKTGQNAKNMAITDATSKICDILDKFIIMNYAL
ncbi:MAG: undecaprenyldiphospho-muramoylpentapeptide beta-N-acetylglucosaminyltransferase [Oscillospiraceae bacterium]|nr:undecaprenyldiphospho-muramoylpentapeptide beta-N-acetylglucosaminyltransferase [Oscillospiraceae bacterium]